MSSEPETGESAMSSSERRTLREMLKSQAAARSSADDHTKARDWLSIFVSLFSVLATVSVWVFWGGRVDQRVSSLEQDSQQQQSINAAAVNLTQDVAVIKYQVGELKKWTERQDSTK